VSQALPSPRSLVSRLDARLDAAVDSLRHPLADKVFYSASELCNFSVLWLLLGAARGLRPSPRDERAAFRLGAAMAVESALVNGLIKSLFRRKRPAWEVVRTRRVRQPRTSSFPSGHASAAFCAAILLAEDDRLWPLYYALAVIVATSRVYVKIHHASDVLAGIPIGVALGVLGRKLVPLDGKREDATGVSTRPTEGER
jgi:membrane-associated phospholipid phosphatase